MWQAEPPVLPDQKPSAIYLAAQPAPNKDRTVGVCEKVGINTGEKTKLQLSPSGAAETYMYRYEKTEYYFREGAKITLLLAPKHGKLILGDKESPDEYFPDKEYSGYDSFTMQIEKDGIKVKVNYSVIVDYPGELEYIDCSGQPKDSDGIWKISQASNHILNDTASWMQPSSLSVLISHASSKLSGFSNFAGGALGKATGEGSSATIALDTTAAGYGWYIDYTPYLNEEYLPTSNPLEWIAKPGSQADGKVDLLTVLLHEYGHVLGLEHSADAHDLMGTTLTSGLRRLPSAEELALMQQLIGVARGEALANADYSPSAASVVVQRAYIGVAAAPGTPDVPLPTPMARSA